MASNNQRPHTSIQPNRVLLAGSPGFSLDLINKALNINGQPKLVVPSRENQLFRRRYHFTIGTPLLKKPMDKWTKADATALQTNSINDLNAMEIASAAAHRQGKTLLALADPAILMNPASEGWAELPATPRPVPPKVWEALNVRDGLEPAKPLKLVNPATFTTPAADSADRLYSPMNQTVLPDAYLESWRMIFIIVDPVKAFPAAYRGLCRYVNEGKIHRDMLGPVYKLLMNLRWTSALHTWCVLQSKRPAPLVIDEADLLRPETGVAARICDELGLDKCIIPNPRVAPRVNGRGQASVNAPAPRVKVEGKNAFEVRIAAHRANWEVEFGEKNAKMIEECVRDAMPRYHRLFANKL
ncbi:hypothetical protein BDW62DRAFT_199676 [Aspergillus aurantiobrunneus]